MGPGCVEGGPEPSEEGMGMEDSLSCCSFLGAASSPARMWGKLLGLLKGRKGVAVVVPEPPTLCLGSGLLMQSRDIL